MKVQRSDIVWLFGLVAAVAIAGGAALLQTKFFIEELIATTSRAETVRSEELATSAFRSMHNQIEKVAIDNGHWDDAVRNSYTQINADWLQDNWGATTAQPDYVYDTAMVVDGMTGDIVAAFQSGKQINVTLTGFLGQGAHELMLPLPADANTVGVTSGFVATPTGLGIAAMAAIVPYDEELRVSKLHPNYLVLIKHLNEKTLIELGEQFLLKDLTASLVRPNGVESHAVHVGHTSIHPHVSWTPNDVVAGLSKSLWRTAAGGLAVVALVLIGLASTSWWYVRKVHASRALALLDARKDPLTGLGNRLALKEHISSLLPRRFSLAFCDLDGFKQINDVHGHHIGDELLGFAATFLSSSCGASASVFRLGGDEFVVCFTGKECLEDAIGFARDCVTLLDKPVDILGRSLSFGMSLGIATSNSTDVDSSGVLRRADAAMYAAKQSPGSDWRVFEAIEGLQGLHDIAKPSRAVPQQENLRAAES